ncbi:MAG: xanthine phosphoribosyltransferase [Chloroflexota bacterium]
MQSLVTRIEQEGRNLGGGILKVDGFINHQLDPALTIEMGQSFIERFSAQGVKDVTKIITAEVSGIAPALATGMVLGVPIVYARKKRPITMPDGFYSASAPSHTKGGEVTLMVSPEYLTAADRVLLIDDFLATGKTIYALTEIIRQSGATLCGIGCVIEKSFEDGRQHLAHLNVPIVTLAVIDAMTETGIDVRRVKG